MYYINKYPRVWLLSCEEQTITNSTAGVVLAPATTNMLSKCDNIYLKDDIHLNYRLFSASVNAGVSWNFSVLVYTVNISQSNVSWAMPYDALPMNEPVLQIRLKKQLSGGRVPHLLQETITRKQSEQYRKTMHHCLHSNHQHIQRYSMAVPHILKSSVWLFTYCLLLLFYEWEMFVGGKTQRQSTLAVCAQTPIEAKALSADSSHTHILDYMDQNAQFIRLKLTWIHFKQFFHLWLVRRSVLFLPNSVAFNTD